MRILFLSLIFISIFLASSFVIGLPFENSTTTTITKNYELKGNIFKGLELFWIIWIVSFVLLLCSCFIFCLLDVIEFTYVGIWILFFILLITAAAIKIVIQFIHYIYEANQGESSEIDSHTGLNKTELTDFHMIPMNTSLIPESERKAKVEEMKFFNLWQWLLLIPFIVVLLSKSCFSSRTAHGCVLIFLGALIVVPIIIKQISYQIEISGKDVYIGGENIIVIRNETAPKPLQRQFACELLNNPDRKFRDCCIYCDLHFRCFNFNFYNETCFPFVSEHEVVYNFYGRQERKRKSDPVLPNIPRWRSNAEKWEE